MLTLGTRYIHQLTIHIQHSSGSSSQCKKAREGNERHTDWKGRKDIPFTEDMTVYVADAKEYTKRPLEPLSFISFQNTRSTHKKSIILYTSNEQLQSEILKNDPSYNSSKMKNLGINLTKHV